MQSTSCPVSDFKQLLCKLRLLCSEVGEEGTGEDEEAEEGGKRGQSGEGAHGKNSVIFKPFLYETFLFKEAALGDVDSGYLNGEESSSEQNSERGEEEDQGEITDSGMEVTQH